LDKNSFERKKLETERPMNSNILYGPLARLIELSARNKFKIRFIRGGLLERTPLAH
jgi:hypothetical protein